MSKRHQIEVELNDRLILYGFFLKFVGEDELVILRVPTGKIASKIILSLFGIALVLISLVIGGSSIGFALGGALLGIIITALPFVSFYSQKNFKIRFSRLKQYVIIERGVFKSKTNIAFSDINYVQKKYAEMDDFVSSETESAISQLYTYSLSSPQQSVELFTISGRKADIKPFSDDLGKFIASFIDKGLKVVE